MSTANYKNFKKIELDVTKKLFKYIYTNVNLNNVIEELDREYSYFYDTENNTDFNIWLSLDYIHKDGKTFTEKFLEESSQNLSSKEREILEERKDSYMSLFEIIKYEKEKVFVKDILTEETFSLIEPELPNIINEGEYVFSRIAKSLDNYNFIGDINYLPQSAKYEFIKKVIFDYNLIKMDHVGLTMKSFLKRFGLNLHKIYDESIFNLIDYEGGLDFYRFNEVEEFVEFKNYLITKMNEDEVDKQLTNLSNIVEFYLSSENMDSQELKNIDLNDFFYTSIEEGLIGVKRELISYIKTLKLYFAFLSKKDEDYTKLYMEINSISKNPFKYIKKLNSYNANFNIDRNFSHYIRDFLNIQSLHLIRDFDLFLLYIEANDIDLTLKKRNIKRQDLIEINKSFENQTSTITKAPNQKDFIIIDLFYHMALELEVLNIIGNKIYFNKKSMDYLLLDDNEKYVIIFDYILGKTYTEDIEDEKTLLLNILSKMNTLKKYSASLFFIDNTNLFFSHGKYLKLLGLIDYDIFEDYSISITSFGKKISTYLSHNALLNKNTLINLDNFIR